MPNQTKKLAVSQAIEFAKVANKHLSVEEFFKLVEKLNTFYGSKQQELH